MKFGRDRRVKRPVFPQLDRLDDFDHRPRQVRETEMARRQRGGFRRKTLDELVRDDGDDNADA